MANEMLVSFLSFLLAGHL